MTTPLVRPRPAFDPTGDDLLGVVCPRCDRSTAMLDRNTGRVTCPCGYDSQPFPPA